MNMTLEQLQEPQSLRLAMGELDANELRVAQAAVRYAYAHFARQSEGVSEEDVANARDAYVAACDDCYPSLHGMRAALTAVWHNRPAQEKAEPVAEPVAEVYAYPIYRHFAGGRAQDTGLRQVGIRFLKTKTAPAGTILYTAPPAPPAERVRVPEGWQPIETSPKDNKRPLYLARFVDGQLADLDFNGVWGEDCESWELQHIRYEYWASANGIEDPTHWAYQDVSAAPEADHD